MYYRNVGKSLSTYQVLPGDILSFGVCKSYWSINTFKKILFNSHKDIRSGTEVGNEWLYRGLKIVQYNLALFLQDSYSSQTQISN